jgi:type I restriction enzyme M protein
VLFRGNVEGQIRKNLVRKGYIKGIIGLPPNLFYGTGIPACIIVIDKENAQGRTGIFIIDASKGFIKDGNKNRLRHQDIHKIVDVFNRQLELPKYSRLVDLTEIEGNDYNLNIPRYIDSSEPEDLQDIEAHLLGGIPNRDLDDLGEYWELFPCLREQLFTPNERPGYSELRVPVNEIKATIFNHPEFIAYTQDVKRNFETWKSESAALLQGISVGNHPKELIEKLSVKLLYTFADVKLVDPYDIYQHLMSYWTGTLQDDVYMIIADGWKANRELVSQELVLRHYFSTDQKAIQSLEAEKANIQQQMVELDEEHGVEGGYLEEAKNDKGKVTKALIIARLRDANLDPEASEEEHQVINNYLSLIEKESEISRKVREAQKALDAKVTAKYSALTEDDVKILLVAEKWLAYLETDLQSELDHVTQNLTGRIKELAERYHEPLSKQTSEVDILTRKVKDNLEKMGFSWK